MMKRLTAVMLALVLLMSFALAETMDPVNSLVAQSGFKAVSARNKTRLSGCWFTEDAVGDTLQWSDKSTTYTVTAKPGNGLKGLYARILDLYTWDTCTYTVNGKVQFAYNAPDADAAKTYKTLRNYARFVSAYLEESGDPAVSGQKGYVINIARKTFHRPDCESAQRIKPQNRDTFDGKRQALIDMGYAPCKKCNP